jgi:cytochrome P450
VIEVDAPEAAAALAPKSLRAIEDLPCPRGLPLLGNLFQLGGPRMHQQLEAWCRTLGPIYRFRAGPRNFVVVGDHEIVAAALRDRPDGFRRDARLEEVGREMGLPPGVFRANGDEWRRQRRMVMAAFSPAHIRRYYPALVGVGQRLAGRWARAADANAVIDLQADLMRFTVDAVAGLAFGSQVNTLESDGDVIQQHLDKIFPAFFKRLMSPLPTWRWIRTPADRRLERSVAAVLAAVDDFVAQARARLAADAGRRENPDNLLEAMIVAADEDGGGIDDRQVAGNVLTMLLAGEDTTANTLAWMIDLLWRHPPALARATDEVRRSIARRGAPTWEEVERLEFVEACAHETMRLKPVAPINGLQALRETVLGDVRIPAGSVVINLMRHDSVSEAHVDRASEFLPERWLADAQAGAAGSSLKRLSTPFGAGPRICPGRYLALLETRLAIATLLGCFDIEEVFTPDRLPAPERLSFTMTPVGLHMRLRARTTPTR